MNEHDIEDMLRDLIAEETNGNEIKRVVTFEEAGVLTGNRGIVIRTRDGSEFQVTIVQSR